VQRAVDLAAETVVTELPIRGCGRPSAFQLRTHRHHGHPAQRESAYRPERQALFGPLKARSHPARCAAEEKFTLTGDTAFFDPRLDKENVSFPQCDGETWRTNLYRRSIWKCYPPSVHHDCDY